MRALNSNRNTHFFEIKPWFVLMSRLSVAADRITGRGWECGDATHEETNEARALEPSVLQYRDVAGAHARNIPRCVA